MDFNGVNYRKPARAAHRFLWPALAMAGCLFLLFASFQTAAAGSPAVYDLTVVKQAWMPNEVDPYFDEWTFDIACTSNGPDCSDITLSDVNPSHTYSNLPEYYSVTLTEDVPDGWTVSSSCENQFNDEIANGDETIVIDTASVNDRDQITCIFTNVAEVGTVTIVKDADYWGDSTSFDFTDDIGVGSFTLDEFNQEQIFEDVPPGDYTVTETITDDWTLDDIDCDDPDDESSTDTGDHEAAIDLDPGEEITCTFTNSAVLGTVTIVKDSDYWGDFTSFDFSDDIGVGNFSLDEFNQAYTFEDVFPGDYTVTETIPDGWTLDDIVCEDDDDETYGDASFGDAYIDVDPGEHVACTFYNEANPGTINIVKDSDYWGDSTTFNFTDNYGFGNFTLDEFNQEHSITDVFPGDYTFTEEIPDGWTLDSIDCDDDDDESYGDASFGDAYIDLDPGESVTCTFYNEADPGTVTIVKDADPEDNTEFTFSDNIEGGGFTLTDPSDNTKLFSDVSPGDYTVSEDAADDWTLDEISCDDPNDDSTTDTGDRAAYIDLDPGEDITCTFFNNVETGTISIRKDANVHGDTPFVFTEDILGTGFTLYDTADTTKVFYNVPTGAYTVTENETPGWVLNSIFCDDDNGTVDDPNRTANINLEKDETVSCIFYNDINSGTITIIKEAYPEDDTAFSFTDNIPGDAFTLSDPSDNTKTFTNVPAGDYEVTETALAGWKLADLRCVGNAFEDVGARTAYITLNSGQSVTCTFVNQAQAELTIIKETDPAIGENFPFTIDPYPIAFILRRGGTGSGAGQLNAPSHVAVDGDGNVYVADQGNHRVAKYDKDGTFLMAWGWDVVSGGGAGFEICGQFDPCKAGVPGTGNGQFNGPDGIAVSNDGYVYVVEAGNHRVQKFTTAGAYVAQFGGIGSSAGELGDPEGVALDAGGNLYVADNGNRRVQKFDSDGNFLLMWGKDVIFGGGTGFEVCTPSDTCQAGTIDGGDGSFVTPTGVAVFEGFVYVADPFAQRIQVFTVDGDYVTKWGSSGSGNGQFNLPTDVAVDAAGNVYVADSQNDRVQKFDSAGNFLNKWGSSGGALGQFGSANAVAVNSAGHVWVSDSTNNYIQEFNQTGIELDDGQSQNEILDAPGTYVISELVLPGWELTDISCDGGNPAVNGNTVAVTLAPGDDVNCTFTNTETTPPEPATLTVVKETDPDGGEGFPFTLDPGAVTFADKWGSSGGGQGQFNGPRGAAFDAAGNVYVADTNNHRIQKFDADGNFLLAWGWDVIAGNGVTTFEVCTPSDTCKAGAAGNGKGQLFGPTAVAVDSDGNVYVAALLNRRVQKFDTDGAFLLAWGWDVVNGNAETGFEVCTPADNCKSGAPGSGDGQFDGFWGVAVDEAGNVYVADTDNHRVQVFDADGAFLDKWGTNGTGNGQFNFPTGVAVYGTTVYVADSNNNRVQQFDTGGNYLDQWGGSGGGDGQFSLPWSIAADPAGNLYVGDANNHRVQKFDGDGNYLNQWGGLGSADGEFNHPYGVAVSAAGVVYVVDTDNHRVQQFSQTGALLDDDQSHPFTELEPGTYLVSELVPADWDLTSIDCDGGSPDENGNTVYVTLAAGDDVTCTFSNTYTPPPPLTGTILIVKNATPADNTTFSFTENIIGDGFTLKDPSDNTKTFSDVPIGNYNVAETVPAPWLLDDIDCDDTNSVENEAAATATINLEADETVTCTFYNSNTPPATADLTIIKTVGGSGAPADWSFDFTGDLGGFGLTDEDPDMTATNLTPGAFNVNETNPAGYATSVSCSNGASAATGALSVTLGAGDDVSCTFTNTICQPGHYDTPAGWTCAPTDAGYFVDTIGASDQLPCQPGTYQPASGQSECLIADAGYYATGPAAINQEQCPPGATSPPGSDSIDDCTPVGGTAAVYMSTTAAGTTSDGLAYGSEDVLKWDGTEWSLAFDGSAAGLVARKAQHNINAFWLPESGDEVLLSFAQNKRFVPGIPTAVDGMDLVHWNGSSFSLYFDGSDVGLTNKTQEKIDGLHALDGSESPIGSGCLAYLLISTAGPGKVPNHTGGTLKFGGEDVLGFCATSLGDATAGLWHKVIDGSDQGMPKNATDSISLSADGETLYLTTKAEFNVDGGHGGHSMVYAYNFATTTFSGPVFIAADAGLDGKVDGLQYDVAP